MYKTGHDFAIELLIFQEVSVGLTFFLLTEETIIFALSLSLYNFLDHIYLFV